eukprot:TRINITY_DN5291_c0_g1_i2.p1 TRINITY_DN5291_c0_g1~~TRINITY_DN5291_c0_g1_i2.p1  ORF type:complete len:726 (+),score=93.96 TRINITY_DN5291_c0_g1_i2:399-2576(+)
MVQGEGTLPKEDDSGVLQITLERSRVQIVVTSDRREDISKTLYECNHSDMIIMMFHTDPSSVEELKTFWAPKVTEAIPNRIPVYILYDSDIHRIRPDHNVLDKLSLGITTNLPFNNSDFRKLLHRFDSVPSSLLMSSRQEYPLFQEYPSVSEALRVIFNIYDADNDGRLNDLEWGQFVSDVFDEDDSEDRSLSAAIDFVARRGRADPTTLPPSLVFPMFQLYILASNPFDLVFSNRNAASSTCFKLGVLDYLWLSFHPTWRRRSSQQIANHLAEMIELQTPVVLLNKGKRCIENLRTASNPRSLVSDLSRFLGIITENSFVAVTIASPDSLLVLLQLLQNPQTDLLALTALSTLASNHEYPVAATIVASCPGLWQYVAKLLPKGSRYMRCAAAMICEKSAGFSVTVATEIAEQLLPVLRAVLLDKRKSAQMEAGAKVLLLQCCILADQIREKNENWLDENLIMELIRNPSCSITWKVLTELLYDGPARQLLAKLALDEMFSQIRQGNADAAEFCRVILVTSELHDSELMKKICDRPDSVRSFSQPNIENFHLYCRCMWALILRGARYSPEDISFECLKKFISYCKTNPDLLTVFNKDELMMTRVLSAIMGSEDSQRMLCDLTKHPNWSKLSLDQKHLDTLELRFKDRSPSEPELEVAFGYLSNVANLEECRQRARDSPIFSLAKEFSNSENESIRSKALVLIKKLSVEEKKSGDQNTSRKRKLSE